MLPVHDNKLFTPAVLSEAVETAYNALLPTAMFDLPKVRLLDNPYQENY